MRKTDKRKISSISKRFSLIRVDSILERVTDLEKILDTIFSQYKMLEQDNNRLRNRERVCVNYDTDGVTHKFCIGGRSIGTGYLIVNRLKNGTIYDITLKMKNDVSDINEKDYMDLYDSFHKLLSLFFKSISIGLSYDVPLKTYIDEFLFTRFEPQGITSNEHIRLTTSVVDYIFKYISKLVNYDWQRK